MDSFCQLPLFAESAPAARKTAERRAARSGSFADNLRLPIHRWFRYSAGFSAEWVETLLAERAAPGITLLDPFAGSGTALLAAEKIGVTAYGYESHPFVYRIAHAKLCWKLDERRFLDSARAFLDQARKSVPALPSALPALLEKCYYPDTLQRLFALREAYFQHAQKTPEWELIWLAVTAVLRACSHVGTAQWQYVLPNKRKAAVLDPFPAFAGKIEEMAADMALARRAGYADSARVYPHDAREAGPLAENSVDWVVTSPPYPNNYDYADATRLEMTFWGEVGGWGDLQDTVRRFIVRSCSQHSAAERLGLDGLLGAPELAAIRPELAEVCAQLAEIRLDKGGKKTYHSMVAAYFLDLAKVFRNLRPLCKPGATLCFVVGDSAPYGVHVPVESWLGRLAVDAGFEHFGFEKLRDRNIKWKNRKHRVPLQEGRLWIDG